MCSRKACLINDLEKARLFPQKEAAHLNNSPSVTSVGSFVNSCALLRWFPVSRGKGTLSHKDWLEDRMKYVVCMPSWMPFYCLPVQLGFPLFPGGPAYCEQNHCLWKEGRLTQGYPRRSMGDLSGSPQLPGHPTPQPLSCCLHICCPQ